MIARAAKAGVLTSTVASKLASNVVSKVAGGMALAGALVGVCGLASPAAAQLRIASFNPSTYNGANARDAAFATILFDTFQGRSMNPDILVCQEFGSSATSINAWLTMMNNRAGANTYAAAPLLTGPDSISVMFYRRSKVSFVGGVALGPSGASPLPPRNTNRFTVRPVGYAGTQATLVVYVTHMKASTTADDQARRLAEAQRIRTDAESLAAGVNFMVAGDFNIQSTDESSFQWLTSSQASNAGRFFDLIRTTGTFNNSSAFRFVHSQAPANSGMDDRFDYMLTNAQIIDGVAGAGLEYIGNQAIAFSTTTWNDPNHSFRTWGNDGSFYNTTINTTAATNAMVGPVIAQALYDAAVTDAAGGHVPIFADFRVPPRASASTLSINLGQIPQNQATSTSVIVSNSGDVGLWTSAGVGTLRYTLSGASGLTAPGGTFTALAGAAGNTHSIGVDTSVVGTFSRSLTIASNSSEEPTLVVQITGEVTGGGPAVCYANCDGSTLAPVLNAGDFICFLSRFQAAQSLPAAQQVGDYANCDGSGVAPVLNAGDFTCFLSRFRAGCP